MFKKLFNKIIHTPFIEDYKQMWPYISRYKLRALFAVLITIPVGAMDAVIAWALKPYMDVMMIEKNTNTYWIPLLIIGFSATQGILTFTANYVNTWVGTRISSDVKIDLFEKLMHFDPLYFDSTTSGNVIMRFNNDVDSACSGLLSNLKQFFTRFFSSVSLVFVLFYNSWQLAIIAVVILLCALFPLTRVRSKIKDINLQTVETNAQVVTNYNESFGGNRVIRSYNLYDYLNARFNATLVRVFKLVMKMVQRTGMLSPLMHFIVSLGIALVIWAGSYLILSQQITAGNFVSFIAALILLYNPIKGIGNNFSNVQIALMAMERVFELLNNIPRIHDKEKTHTLRRIKKAIEYRNVNFEYIADKPVLTDINLHINKGETVAFVGNSGGGKTTLVNLLPRFYEVKSGKIMIDGKDIRQYSLMSLRDNIAVVFQDNFLFSGTIRDNILLGKANATEAELEYAVNAACVSEFLPDLPNGLDTEIG